MCKQRSRHLSGPIMCAPTRILFLKKDRSMVQPRGVFFPSFDGLPPLTFVAHPLWVSLPNTRIHVRLLGPCFKTGRTKPKRRRPQRASVVPVRPDGRSRETLQSRSSPRAIRFSLSYERREEFTDSGFPAGARVFYLGPEGCVLLARRL